MPFQYKGKTEIFNSLL